MFDFVYIKRDPLYRKHYASLHSQLKSWGRTLELLASIPVYREPGRGVVSQDELRLLGLRAFNKKSTAVVVESVTGED